MKKIRNILKVGVVCVCLGLFQACHPSYLAYDEDLKDGIYFASDSVGFQFGMNKGEDIDRDIYVRVLGMPKAYDRTFEVEFVPEETTAKRELHFDQTAALVVPANEVLGKISFVLHRYLDPELTKEPVVIKMRLKENEHFRVLMTGECKFEFSDTELPQPVWWQDRYLGPYSQLLMIDILNSYWDLEETRPLLYERFEEMYGRNLLGSNEGGSQAPGFPYQQQVVFLKYVITPVYEYYQEHPHEGIDIPDPAITINI
ncbi:MAG: DUF4843 domain-containing protein [Odoribacter sp.]|nr:DUF4843 domain-containing protein [Odoribacter sp.]